MKSHDFRVSVIITSYNHKDYLVEAIESVINQTISPYEIIIADDHSIDGSVELIRDYIDHYPGWIKGIFQKENVGIPKNRNAALCQVMGDWVAILDGDDRFLPHKLEREMETLQNYPVARCVYSNVSIIDAKGFPMGLRDKEDQPFGDVFAYVSGGKFGLLRSMLIECNLLQKVGFLDERFPKYDGFELTVRLAKRSQFVYVPQPLVEYRVHPSGDSRSLKGKDHLHDLEGIYRKNMPLLDDVGDAERRDIQRKLSRRIAEIAKRAAREEIEKGNRRAAFKYWLKSIRYAPNNFASKLAAQILLPRWAYQRLRAVYRRFHNVRR